MDSGLTEIDLSTFTGKGVEHYGSAYVLEALAQAGDLFELATGLLAFPADGTLSGRLARRGVLQMAEAIFEGNTYRDLRYSPFRSEQIGSYNYAMAEGNVLAGIPTGISWFDLAVERLKADVQSISNSSIAAFPRPGDLARMDGQDILVGPADTEEFRQGRRYLGVDGGLPD